MVVALGIEHVVKDRGEERLVEGPHLVGRGIGELEGDDGLLLAAREDTEDLALLGLLILVAVDESGLEIARRSAGGGALRDGRGEGEGVGRATSVTLARVAVVGRVVSDSELLRLVFAASGVGLLRKEREARSVVALGWFCRLWLSEESLLALVDLWHRSRETFRLRMVRLGHLLTPASASALEQHVPNPKIIFERSPCH